MSFMFSKNREKRSRSSTGESNSSFVKNVTSRVSGLLPVGITKWFSSPSSSSGNGSAAVADGTDSSTEDEAPESPITVPPPKRFRYSSPVRKYSQLTTSETTTTSNVATDTGSVLYSSIQSSPGRHAYRREPNFLSAPSRSLAHNPEHSMSANISMDRSESDQCKQHTVSAIGHFIARKRKSLFNSDRQKEQSLTACAKTSANQVKDYKQPHFKPHLLGSPFYPGSTMYGGASASYSSTRYVTHPNILQRKMTYVTESQDAETVNMSTSSRQVMDLLENYSSPLIEAKRIPRYELTELTDINSTMHSMSRTSNATTNSLKRQELHMPTKASLIRMKARNRLQNSTKAARQIIASHSSSLPFYQPYAAALPKHNVPERDFVQSIGQSKLKSRLTRTHGGSDPLEMPDAVELPTAVLRIDQNNLPSFSFGTNDTQPTKVIEPNTGTFKFSSPLPATTDAPNVGSSLPTFNFDSPRKAAVDTSPTIYSYENQIAPKNTETIMNKPLSENDTKSTAKTVIAFAKASNEWKCSDCWVSNKADAPKCVCCGSKQPSKESNTSSGATSKCTTCKLADTLPNSDKCVNCEKFRTCLKTSNSLAVTTSSSAKWKCGDCWVDNEENSEKCVCCGSRNPKKTNAGNVAAVVPTTIPGAPIERDWRCEDCLITNKPSITKCAACGGNKPAAKTPLPPVTPTTSNSTNFITDNKFAQIIKSQKASWECRVCLASNANEKTACSCCETDKNGGSNEAAKLKNFKFNMEPNTGFKFGIDPKAHELNLAKKVDVVTVSKKPEESETNNNVVPKIPSFSLPTKKPEEAAAKAGEAPKPSFSFGIPAQTASLASGFVPSKAPSATKLTDIVKPVAEEKPQEVPSISFKVPEAKQTSGWSSSPVSTSNPTNAMNVFLKNTSHKDATTSISKSTPTTTESSKPQFSFSGSVVTPKTGGLFSSQASPAVSSSLTQRATTTAGALFPEPPASTTMSLFSKPVKTTEASAAGTSTLFQNTRGTLSATVSAPIFSFGTSQSNPAPTTETKATFSFSASTTPAFGAAQQPAPTNTLSNGPSGMSNPLAQSIAPMHSGNGLASNGNALLTGGASMFNTPTKENTMWPGSDATNRAHSFVSSTPLKPAFTFGATSVASPFGASSAPPVAFSGGVPAQSMFGMSQDGGGQPMFSAAASQPAPPMFGAASSAGGMFGAPAAPPPFGAPAAMASFDSPAPAFNFGTPQAAPGVFGFGQTGQQPQQQMQSMPGSFGFNAPAAGQMQFAIGSAPNQSPVPTRRIRKAVRRNR